MAQFIYKVSGGNQYFPYLVLTVNEVSQSIQDNETKLSFSLVLKRPSRINSTAKKDAYCFINGWRYSFSGSVGGYGDLTLISGTETVQHNNDGTKSVDVSAVIDLDITFSGVYIHSIAGSDTLQLTTIPRYATVSQTLSAKTETTATIKWSSDKTIDYIWYSIDNGSTWTGINVSDGTSGSYTISGLSAGTTYNIKTRVRNKASQLTTDSSALSVQTYFYPYANSMPDFTIGDTVTIGVYNPLGRTFTITVIGADNSELTAGSSYSGTSVTGFKADSYVNFWYRSIPNAKSGTYKVKITYGSISTTKTGGKYSVNLNDCAPVIGSASYRDTNNAVIAITEDDQKILRNLSTVRYDATGLAANKSATIASCKVVVNGNTYNLTVSGSTATGGDATIDSGSNISAVFTVTDSRGVTASKSVTIQMIDYALPSAIISLARQNNFYSETDITVDADYSSVDGKNQITISYKCKINGTSSFTVTGTLQDNVEATIVLNYEKAWDVVVTLVDRFGGTTTYNLYLSRGMPIIYFDRLKSSVGINCFPKDEKSIEVNGVNLERNVMTRSLSAAMTDLAVNTYTVIPFDLSNVAGGKLTATNDGGIEIGANVSKVLISGMLSYDTINSTGSRHIRIVKNSYTANNTLAWSWQTLVQSQPANVEILPVLADVQEGDVIYMLYYTGNSADKIGGNTYGCRTSLTVQVVE